MKNFLVLNIEEEFTRYFTVDNIPMAKAKCKQLNWSNDKTIVCSLIEGFYEPTLAVSTTRMLILDAKIFIDHYVANYMHACSHLPVNFLYTGRLRK